MLEGLLEPEVESPRKEVACPPHSCSFWGVVSAPPSLSLAPPTSSWPGWSP